MVCLQSTLSGAGAGSVTFAVTPLTIPSFQTNITWSFSKAQVAGLSCACISHPPWLVGGEKEKKPSPSFPPLDPCLEPRVTQRTLSCSLVSPQQKCYFTSMGDGTKPKIPNPESPRIMVHPALGDFFHVSPRPKMLLCKLRVKKKLVFRFWNQLLSPPGDWRNEGDYTIFRKRELKGTSMPQAPMLKQMVRCAAGRDNHKDYSSKPWDLTIIK